MAASMASIPGRHRRGVSSSTARASRPPANRGEHASRDEELVREVVQGQVGERQQHHAHAIGGAGFRIRAGRRERGSRHAGARR